MAGETPREFGPQLGRITGKLEEVLAITAERRIEAREDARTLDIRLQHIEAKADETERANDAKHTANTRILDRLVQEMGGVKESVKDLKDDIAPLARFRVKLLALAIGFGVLTGPLWALASPFWNDLVHLLFGYGKPPP